MYHNYTYIYIYIYISATALLAVRRASSYSVPLWSCNTSTRPFSIGPWGLWVLGTCSGSVLVLRLVMEVVVLGTPHPRSRSLSLIPAVTRFPSKVVKNNTSKRLPKNTPNKPTEAWKVPRFMKKTHSVSKCVMCVWHSKNHTILLPYHHKTSGARSKKQTIP